VTIKGGEVALRFRAKGGQIMRKTIEAPHLAIALRRLRRLAGKRLFQYRDDDGRSRAVRARQVNEFLCSPADAPVTLKDFRTLAASATVVRILAKSPRRAVNGAEKRRFATQCDAPLPSLETRLQYAEGAMSRQNWWRHSSKESCNARRRIDDARRHCYGKIHRRVTLPNTT
jgi:hypothetical protein